LLKLVNDGAVGVSGTKLFHIVGPATRLPRCCLVRGMTIDEVFAGCRVEDGMGRNSCNGHTYYLR